MKTIKSFLILAGLCFVSFVSAQQHYGQGNTINGPSHPLKPTLGLPRIMADTVGVTTHMEAGHPESMYPYLTQEYTFHENNRVDTIMTLIWGTILKYSDKGRLLSASEYTPGRYIPDPESPSGPDIFIEPVERLMDEFEYGEDGRMVKAIHYGFEGDSAYVDTIYTYHYTMTDSGYIMGDVEYILDDQDRLSCLKFLNSEDEYVLDPEGRRLRVGDVYYSYFDNGFRSLKYSHRGELVWGVPDAWTRMDYFFQDKGYLSEKIDYLKEEGETEWTVYNHYQYEYFYRADNPLANVALEEQPGSTVYAVNGAVMIETESAATVSIYSFGGQLVAQQRAIAGINRITLSKGLYVVVIDGKGYKVAVK